MNGVWIGRALILVLLRRILQVLLVVRTVCAVVVVGATVLGAAVRLTVPAALPTTVATASGFAWFSPSNAIYNIQEY